MSQNPDAWPKPPNEDTSLPPRHVHITAATGGGKSQLTRNDIVPKRGARVLLWDVDHDHDCLRFENRNKFVTAVESAVKSKKPFRLGWSGDDSKETFFWFCYVAWRILDGAFDTYIVVEEAADLELGQTLKGSGLGTLMRRGRKYGAIVISTTQRVQEIPKGLVTQSPFVYVGKQKGHDAKYLEKMLGLPAEDMRGLEPLSFYKQDGNAWALFKTKYRAFGNKSGKRNAFKR